MCDAATGGVGGALIGRPRRRTGRADGFSRTHNHFAGRHAEDVRGGWRRDNIAIRALNLKVRNVGDSGLSGFGLTVANCGHQQQRDR